MKRKWLIAVFLMLCLSSNAYSMPTNFGFEKGDTSGWTETIPDYGSINVVTSWTGGGTTYKPIEGKYFAVLKTGSPDGVYTTLSQSFSMKGGDKLEGWAGFCCGEEVYSPYPPSDSFNYNDYSLIRILKGYSNIPHELVVSIPWYADSYDISYEITTPTGERTGQVVYFGPVQWEHWSWTASEPGLYTLQYQTTQGGDAEYPSYAFFDAAQKTMAVSEASLISLLCVGIFTLYGARKFSS